MTDRRPARLPWLARAVLLLFLRRESARRALADLEDVHVRVRVEHGERAARWRCVREAWLVVLWTWAGRVLPAGRRREHGAGAGAAKAGGGRGSVARGVIDDLRFGVRALVRRPGFALMTVLVLGLGIGANVTIFSLASRLFLASPPAVEAPDRLVRVFRSSAPGQGGSVSYPDYLDYREGATQLSGLMAYSSSGAVVKAHSGEAAVEARVWPVTDNYFAVLGVDPALGRFFTPEENTTPGTHAVAVVSYGYWVRALGGDAGVLGSTVRLNGTPFTVVGVTPAAFRGLGPAETLPDLFIPVMMRDAIQPASRPAWRERIPEFRENWLVVVGRLAPAASLESARAELVAIADRIATLHPRHNEGESVLVSAQFRYYPSTGRVLSGITRVLLTVVLLVLAIASANAAILLLSRTTSRGRELGIRAAIGSGRSRVVRLLLAESLLLALAGGVVGLLLSVWGTSLGGALLPVPITNAPIDGRVLAFALLVSVFTAIVVGTAPALRAARTDVADLIRGHVAGRAGRVQSGLVILQVALSLLLVAGAALFARSLTAARERDVGFSTERALLVEVNLRNHGYDAERGRAFVRGALEQLSALPGIERATTLRQVPFQGDWTTTLEPWPGATFEQPLEISLDAVSPDFFAALDMPIVRGRPLDARDRDGTAPVVVVNEALAAAFFGAGDAVGGSFPLDGEGGLEFTVVGVTRNATYHRLGESGVMRAYLALDQFFQPWVTFLIRSAGPPLAHVDAVRAALHDLDPDVAIAEVTTLSAVFDGEIARFRVTARLTGLFGVLALVLAAAGLYGVLSFVVLHRVREIGVCVALGATRRRIAGDVLRRGLGLTLAGIAIGMVAAFALARLVRSLLFETAPRDPVSFALAPAILLVVALLAMLVPVRRATAIDPMRAIRAD